MKKKNIGWPNERNKQPNIIASFILQFSRDHLLIESHPIGPSSSFS
jgi:hypothetical protein